jgi:DNA-binding NarL/FixJ family response regulator
MEPSGKVKVVVCETQPVTGEGLKCLISRCADFEYIGTAPSLQAISELIPKSYPTVVLLDKALGSINGLIQWIGAFRFSNPNVSLVVWGTPLVETDALRLVQAGVKGVIRKTVDADGLLACLRSAAAGVAWLEDGIFRQSTGLHSHVRPGLTNREQQVASLVEQGLNNRQIAQVLNICPGTVKVHLKHIFEKTGVRDRYGLALSGLQSRKLLQLPAEACMLRRDSRSMTQR